MCAFRYEPSEYDACVGNPPYVRHHDIESDWRKKVQESIALTLGIELSGIANLYLYFLCLAFIKTKSDGIIGSVIPYEWVSRPSAKPIRDYLKKQGWAVSVYRFKEAIFGDVLTTACITIIDKRGPSGPWRFYDVAKDLSISERRGISGSGLAILKHSERGDVYCRRGISPGGQSIFTFTETERLAAGLWLSDVIPCVTSLRSLPASKKLLTRSTFHKYFVEAEERCWLLKSTTAPLSARVLKYVKSVPLEHRNAYACQHQAPWYNYEKVATPDMLFHSGFMKRGPKVVINTVGAQAVGSVYSVFVPPKYSVRKLRSYLSKYNFEQRIVALARTLKKVDVAQLNSVLIGWGKKISNGRKATS